MKFNFHANCISFAPKTLLISRKLQSNRMDIQYIAHVAWGLCGPPIRCSRSVGPLCPTDRLPTEGQRYKTFAKSSSLEGRGSFMTFCETTRIDETTTYHTTAIPEIFHPLRRQSKPLELKTKNKRNIDKVCLFRQNWPSDK